MNPTAKQTGKTAANLARLIARQATQEPLEILKSAKAQVIGAEAGQSLQPEHQNSNTHAQEEPKTLSDQEQTNNKIKGARMMEALNRELSDISREKLFSELQRKIAEREEVYLSDYPNLSMEQKQVLNAQIQAVKIQRQNMQNSQNQGLIEPASKKGRRLFSFGKKQEMKRQQTRVENVVPPSG